MNHTAVKVSAAFVCLVWVAFTAAADASWPVIVIPIVLLFWLLPAAPRSEDLSELVIQLKVLNERLGVMDDCLRAMDTQLDEQSLQLTHLVDERLHAMRVRGEIPWP